MSTSPVNSMPALRARPTLKGPPNGAVGSGMQQAIRFLKLLWK